MLTGPSRSLPCQRVTTGAARLSPVTCEVLSGALARAPVTASLPLAAEDPAGLARGQAPGPLGGRLGKSGSYLDDLAPDSVRAALGSA